MLQKYKFWSYDIPETFERKMAIVTLKENEGFEEELKKAMGEMEEAEANRNEMKKQLDDANGDNIHSIKLQYSTKSDKYIEKRAEVSRLEEQHLIQSRNRGMKVCVERLKDVYSRKENIIVTLIINNVSDGKVISTVGKIKEDIYKLEDFGVYLTAPYYDELAKLIANIYYDIDIQEREFIENDVPQSAVKAFARMICEEIEESEESFINDKGYYDIPVKIFKGWYDNSSFRRFTLTNLKEALIIHGYAKANKGRNEYTVAKVGKVVRLNISELEKVRKHEK